jgi:hypothetical protein
MHYYSCVGQWCKSYDHKDNGCTLKRRNSTTVTKTRVQNQQYNVYNSTSKEKFSTATSLKLQVNAGVPKYMKLRSLDVYKYLGRQETQDWNNTLYDQIRHVTFHENN